MIIRVLSGLCLCMLIAACGGKETADTAAPDHVSGDALRGHVTALASDALGGRKPGTQGYDKAAQYVADAFSAVGLEPAGVQGTYFQPIVFKTVTLFAPSALLSYANKADETPILFEPLKSYYFIPNPAFDEINMEAELVFAGYGVCAPDYGLDSFAGLDAKGKIVVALAGSPARLNPEVGAVLGSIKRKAKDAQAAGAAGLILLYSKGAGERVDFPALADRSTEPQPYWLSADGAVSSPYGTLKVIVGMSPGKGARFFTDAQQSLEDVLKAADAGQPVQSFALQGKISARFATQSELMVSSNVIGKLPTTVKASPDEVPEALLMITHLDHLGTKQNAAENQDNIYNGAIDNALGVASLIETAKALGLAEPERTKTVYFAALTAEENGLLGSQYLTHTLPVPADKLNAVLNIDMPVALYPFATVQASGQAHSSLGQVAQAAAGRYGLTLEPDPMPEEAIFVRSDHYSFVERAIPSLYLNIGVKAAGDAEIDGLAALNRFLSDHYHQVSDEVDLPINWPAAARFADVHVEMLRSLLRREEPVTWSEDSFFNRDRRAD